eukprot:scaffold9901_cov65-Phaeocystis_antarctica.AAC.4
MALKIGQDVVGPRYPGVAVDLAGIKCHSPDASIVCLEPEARRVRIAQHLQMHMRLLQPRVLLAPLGQRQQGLAVRLDPHLRLTVRLVLGGRRHRWRGYVER